jgi:hypothetical protein
VSGSKRRGYECEDYSLLGSGETQSGRLSKFRRNLLYVSSEKQNIKQENKLLVLSQRANYVYGQSGRRFSASLLPTFADRGCHVISVTDPYGRILGFLDRSRNIFLKVAPQLYSRGSVDPVHDPLLVRKSGSAGNRTQTCGSVARNSD